MNHDYITINDNEFVHLSTVKRLRMVTAREREELAGLGEHVDAQRFNTRVDYAGGKKSYVPETLADITAQGVKLVEVDHGAFVPAQHIGRVRNLTEQDRTRFEQRNGRPLRSDFKAEIETRAGKVLSTLDGAAVMQRISRAQHPINAPAHNGNGQNQSMAQKRDAAMSNAKPRSRSAGREPAREPEVR